MARFSTALSAATNPFKKTFTRSRRPAAIQLLLTALPDELLLHILTFLLVLKDISSISRCCKRLCGLAIPHLYSSPTFNKRSISARSLYRFAHTVMKDDAALASHIRHLTIDPLVVKCPRDIKKADLDFEFFRKAVRASSTTVEQEGQWLRSLKAWDTYALLAILLPEFTRLNTLGITVRETAYMKELLRPPANEQRLIKPLSCLKNASVVWSDYHREGSYQFLAQFLKIDTMRRLCASSIQLKNIVEEESAQFLEPETSLITDLMLINCALAFGELQTLIRACKVLKMFQYEQSNNDKAVYGPLFSPPELRSALCFAQESLESLWIDYSRDSRPLNPRSGQENAPFGSFTDFSHLKNIRTSITVLLGPGTAPPARVLTQILLSTLEMLHITRCAQYVEDWSKEQVNVLVAELQQVALRKEESFPCLERIIIECQGQAKLTARCVPYMNTDQLYDFPHLRQLCKEHDISLFVLDSGAKLASEWSVPKPPDGKKNPWEEDTFMKMCKLRPYP